MNNCFHTELRSFPFWGNLLKWRRTRSKE